MKALIFVCALVLISCEEEPLPVYCWECNSILYGRHIEDIVCDKTIIDINEYQSRLTDFYKGGLTYIDCQMKP